MRKFYNNQTGEKSEIFLIGKGIINDPALKDRKKFEWLEDNYINYDEDEINRGNKNFLGLFLSIRQLIWCYWILILVISILFFRTVYLQIIKGEEYYQLAENNRLRVYHIQSPRGIIYDRKNVPLVKNIPNFSLYLTPVDYPKDPQERQKILNKIKNNLNFNEESQTLYEKILTIPTTKKEYYQPQLLVNRINYEEAIKLKIQSFYLPGISVEVNNQREYLTNRETEQNPTLCNSLSHILGYVGKVSPEEYLEVNKLGYLYSDIIGKTGLEKFYEKELRGKYGKKQIEVDSRGKEKKIIAQEDLIKGNNLVLSIDLKVQEKLEELLRNTLKKEKLKKAVGIVSDPNDGSIIALVSLPSYNNNDFARGIEKNKYQELLNDSTQPLYNRAISGEYPSGSVIKPIIAIAALEEKIINQTTSFISSGGIRINQWFFPDWASGGHGQTNVYKAISQSVNTFFYIIGGGYKNFKGLGVYKMVEYGQKFGLSKKTNIDLPGEKSGFLPTPEWKKNAKNEPWYIGDTYHMAIGQGDVLVTPLQVNNYMAAFANGGTLYQPQIVKYIINSKTGEKKEILPQVLNANFVEQKNLNIIRQALRQTVTTGSGRLLNSLPIEVAGKTGTAQFSNTKKPHAWFSGFAPFNQPKIAFTILFEEGGEGSEVAVPVAKDFLEWYFTEEKL